MTPVPPGIPRVPPSVPPVPIERPRAAGMLAGLLLFGIGFLLAAVVAVAGHGGGPLYLTAVGLGFLGIGLVAFFRNRGTVPLPEGPVWGRPVLAGLARAVDLPAAPVTAVVYGLIAIGFIGNMLPILRGQ